MYMYVYCICYSCCFCLLLLPLLLLLRLLACHCIETADVPVAFGSARVLGASVSSGRPSVGGLVSSCFLPDSQK